MKKILFALIILVVWAPLLSAKTYKSPFGFSIDIPAHWLIMSKQEIKDNPDLFNFESNVFKNFNKDMISKIKDMITSGQTEIYFNKKTANVSFADNINVIKTIERLPQKISELKQYCAMFPKEIYKYCGVTPKIYKCEFKKIAGLDCSYIIYDGVIDRTKNILCQIQKSPNVAIIITASSKIETFEIIRKEFDEMLASLKFY